MLSIASIIASLVIVAIVIFFATKIVTTVKSELDQVRSLLIQIANGTFNGEFPPPKLKEGAQILSAIQKIAKEVQQQQRTVEHLVYTDELTGLANRRRFEDELTRGFHFAKRGLPMCIVSFGINNLEEIHTKAGRAKGDQVIADLAEILKNNIRKTDLSARLGSDDFALVLPNMEEHTIRGWLSELNSRFLEKQKEDETLKNMNAGQIRFGYSFVRQDADSTPQQVFDRATQARSKAQAGTENNIVEEK
jgi:diguanylate cyclase (GGDEF)-like protein